MTRAKASLPPDQAARDEILRELDVSMLVEASAGTGKTTSIVGRMVALLEKGKCPVETLAAVTFTHKAAAELRGRFQVALEAAAAEARGEARGRLQAAAAGIDRCFVGTIHSFCGRLLRERPVEAGVEPAFTTLDPESDGVLREESWEAFVAEVIARDDPVLRELEGLGLEIRLLKAAFLEIAGYPDVEEWPAPKIEPGDLGPARKALREHCERLGRLASTLPEDAGNDDLMPAMRRLVRTARCADLEVPAELLEVLGEIRDVKKIVQRNWPGGGAQAKAELERWNAFASEHAAPTVLRWLERRYGTVVPLLRRALEVYDRRRREAGGLNYQDLLVKAAALLRREPEVRRYFQRRFTHLLVDEFQDTDPVQAEVMLLLTATDPAERNWTRCVPRPGSLFVVGDPKQSIYRFRRADIVTYGKVRSVVQESGGKVVALAANFRAIEPLVDWVNRTFAGEFPEAADVHNAARSPLLVGRAGEGGGDFAGVRVLDVPEEHGNKASIAAFEADLIARTIRRAIDGGLAVPRTAKELERGETPVARPRDFLVVTRGKRQLDAYGQCLERLGIPHEVSGGSAPRIARELFLLGDCLRAATETHDPTAVLAALRGELFGFSDPGLYAFRRAGGRFEVGARVPERLRAEDPEVAAALDDALSRLARYGLWLRLLPPVAAFERIAADLGLTAWAAAAEGGNVRAGSLLKTLQTLRARQAGLHLATDIVRLLEELVEGEAEVESIPARPHEQGPVRVMNLHKAKGLEAPVVFLADPTGVVDREPRIHIDRSGGQVKGYLQVREEDRGYRAGSLLAQPEGWEALAAEEKRFLDAERKRLLYVAATRAGAQLTIARRAKDKRWNPWLSFEPALEGSRALEDPGPASAPARPAVKLAPREPEVARAAGGERWEACRRPTYAAAAAKLVSVKGPSPAGVPRGERGAEWGTVIHTLLETAMKEPAADLAGLARAALAEEGLDPGLAGEAVEVVQAVASSDVWRRALAAERRLAEVPFERLVPEPPGGVVTLLRGVIDLVFLEAGGWVIVDYKTDGRGEGSLKGLVERYRPQVEAYKEAWEAMTGMKVKEAGLYFTRWQRYERV
ncbi:MAG: UvrD-helicase domain-containing protein [Planctomycetes bacterium]|nr:UvrD-helicase domain-containing protein [Planctomycetota bacterium]